LALFKVKLSRWLSLELSLWARQPCALENVLINIFDNILKVSQVFRISKETYMQHKLPPLPVRIAIVAIVLGLIGYFGYQSLNGSTNGQITASGSIEGAVVNVSPDLAGKVLSVDVEDGQTVNADDLLLRLDPTLLNAQRAVAAANLEAAKAGAQTAQNALGTAKTQYQLALEAALAQDKKTRTQDWFADTNQFDQPNWYFSRVEQLQAAQGQVDIALKAWEDAKANLENLNTSVDKSEFLKAEKRLLDARLAYTMAKSVNNLAQNSADANAPVGKYNRTHCGTNAGYVVTPRRLTNFIYGCRGDDYLAAVGDDLYDAAEKELDEAQKSYDTLLDTQVAADVLKSRAEVSVAQERYYAALDLMRKLQTGDQSTGVLVAQGALSQAQAAADQAQKTVEQAQANLDLLDAQIAKLEIHSVMDGVILTRNVEPGEFVQPGAVALTMADLSNITITVYVPEDRYGQISLGQKAEVRVDSFPGMAFTATVIQISNQAEFTPRNVQTVEGRSATFYAIKLQLDDPEGKLKIGMPADVIFVK
jgi:multidrug resistance efflux pump